jgi:hypothetical protein
MTDAREAQAREWERVPVRPPEPKSNRLQLGHSCMFHL